MAWVVERIAEQRLLWNLRGQTTATVAHPSDMTFDQVWTMAEQRKVPLRLAAYLLAVQRVADANNTRGVYP